MVEQKSLKKTQFFAVFWTRSPSYPSAWTEAKHLPATQREWLRDNKRRELADPIGGGGGVEPIIATAKKWSSLLVFFHEYAIYKINNELFTFTYEKVCIFLKWNT